MAEYLIQGETLDDIADAINAKTGGSSAMTPAEMVTEIGSIPTGGGGLDVARLVPGTYSWGSVDADGTIHKPKSPTGNIPLTKPFSVSNGDTIEVCFLKGARQYAHLALYSGSTQIAYLNSGNITPPYIKAFTVEVESDSTIDNVVVGFNAVTLTKIAVFVNENLVLA